MSSSVIVALLLILVSIFGDFYTKFALASDDLKCGISYFNDTEDGHQRIYHGDKAALGQFPWLAAVIKNGIRDCTGTIISEEYILTAGHCTEHRATYQVIVGSLTTTTNDTKLDVIAYSHHPEYSCVFNKTLNTCKNDIGIMKLAKPLEFSSNVQPICLAASFDGDSSPEPEDESVLAAGWGLNDSHGVDTLLYGHMHFVDIQTCTSKHSDGEISKDMHICAAGKKQHTDYGDSGGPIFIQSQLTDTETGRHRYVEVGITSFGFDPDVFARVSTYCEFISKSTEGKVNCVNL